jgi:conjugal transfer mating pair stabilization protein TraN
LGTNCFSTHYTNDADFAQTMTFMEAAREAGVYLDPTTTKVFSGEPNVCRDRLLKNCCYADSAGASMSNQRLFTTGSRLVYDLLMNSNNRNFVKAGLTALMRGGGFTGTYSTFGISVAVNGSSLPAGSMVLGSGENYVIAIDPWSLAITATIYILADLSQCNKAESLAALKEGAHLCHAIGTWCSECFRVLGHCVSCIERSTGKCCFNSRLARMINEQGRQQLGLGWGTPERPACDGFTVGDLQRLDFSRMDLTEFYDSIVPSMPNVPAIQAGARERAANCYRGGGKC